MSRFALSVIILLRLGWGYHCSISDSGVAHWVFWTLKCLQTGGNFLCSSLCVNLEHDRETKGDLL